MRTVAITSFMALALVMASFLSGFTQQPQQVPQPLGTVPLSPPQSGFGGGDVQVVSTAFANGVQQLVYVDTKLQTIAVYHVQVATGKLELKSVRKISFDLEIEQFNAAEPLPSEMRLLRQ